MPRYATPLWTGCVGRCVLVAAHERCPTHQPHWVGRRSERRQPSTTVADKKVASTSFMSTTGCPTRWLKKAPSEMLIRRGYTPSRVWSQSITRQSRRIATLSTSWHEMVRYSEDRCRAQWSNLRYHSECDEPAADKRHARAEIKM